MKYLVVLRVLIMRILERFLQGLFTLNVSKAMQSNNISNLNLKA